MSDVSDSVCLSTNNSALNKEQLFIETKEVTNAVETRSDQALLHVSRVSKILMVIIFCLMLAVNGLDINVLGDASPYIAAHFDAFDRINWLSNITLLISSSVMLISAKLFGCIEPKYIIVASLLLMALAESLAGASTSFEMLVAGRAIAGISQSFNIVGATTIVGLITDAKRRPLMVSMVLACYGLMIKVGPLVAGAILKRPQAPWRWCFYFQIPIIVIIILLTILFFPITGTYDPRGGREILRKSWINAIVQGAAVICMTFPFIAGGSSETYRWTGPSMVVCYALAPVLLPTFLYLEAKCDEEDRLIPLDAILQDRSVALMGVVSFCAGYVVFSSCFWIPIMLQVVFGSSPLRAAVQMLPSALTGTLATVVVGKIAELTGHFIPSCVLLSLLQIVAGGLCYTWHYDSPLWKIYVYSSLGGIGAGGLSSIGTPFTLEKVSLRRYAAGAAFSTFCLISAAAVAIGIQSVILTEKISKIGPQIHALDPALDLSSGIWKSLIFILAGSSEVKDVFRKSFMEAVDAASLVNIAIGVLSLSASLGMRWQKMHQHDQESTVV